MRMLCRQFAQSGETKESVSNDDGDGNKNGKKAENGSSVIVCSEKSFIVAQLKTHFSQSNCFSSKSNLLLVLELSERYSIRDVGLVGSS